LLYHTKNFALPEIEHVREGQDSSPEPTRLDEELFSLPLTPDIGSLPKLNKRLNLSNSDPFRRRPPLRSHNTGSTGLLRFPDRFLPNRSPLDALSQSYHVKKEAHKLSTVEKLLRRDIASIDAFSPRRRATSPIPLTALPTSEQVSGSLRVGGEAERLNTLAMLKQVRSNCNHFSRRFDFHKWRTTCESRLGMDSWRPCTP
jgi:hypothetical protein